MSQPIWKTISCSDYFLIQEDTTGIYPPEAEVAQEDTGAADDSPDRFYVYRFSLDRMEEVRDGDQVYFVLSSIAESYRAGKLPYPISSYREWFLDSLSDIARSIGASLADIRADLSSENLMHRFFAYQAIGGYHGFDNLDGYPLIMGEAELNKRWEK